MKLLKKCMFGFLTTIVLTVAGCDMWVKAESSQNGWSFEAKTSATVAAELKEE